MSRKAKGPFVPAKGSKPVRREPPGSPPEDCPSKRQKTAKSVPQSGPVSEEDRPIGLEWDGEDYSCTYDTLFIILYDIWVQDLKVCIRRLRGIGNEFLTVLSKGFRHFEAGKMSLDVRDGIGFLLHAHSHRIVFVTDEGHLPLYLRGIIYSGGYHFTAQIICPDGSIWYHDEQKGHLGEKNGSLKSKNDKKMRSCRGRKLVLAIYAQE